MSDKTVNVPSTPQTEEVLSEEITNKEETEKQSIAEHEESEPHESVIDYAKNTVNSFLSMYGYDERVTTESLSNIKSEPISPSKDYAQVTSEASNSTIRTEDKVAILSKTATVTPLRNCSSTSTKVDSESILVGVNSTRNLDGAPRKPITPYMRYRNMIFQEIKHKYPGCSPYDLACLISSKWSMLTDSERQVWEEQYEEDMKKYNENLKTYYAHPNLKRDWMQEKKTPEPQSPAQTRANTQEESRYNGRSGLCNWCKHFASLQEFSSVLEGREIYCSGLCSEKCFIEAAQQICSVESGNNKVRYIGSDLPHEEPLNQVQPIASVTSSSSHSSSSSSSFNWDVYLAETNATVAPWTYFNHSRNPPANNFTVGMKLESCSHSKATNVKSLATVKEVCGARILLHFDGTHSNLDVWKLCDSADIFPAGWREGSKLRAPIGYKFEEKHYGKFYSASLQNATIAPSNLFHKEPTGPLENYFSIGMKLEAVVKQTPHIIRVATVVDVDRHEIKIEFAGYKGVGYWCGYKCRDIFPAGWCLRTGHPLQPPGTKVDRLHLISSRESSTPPLESTSSGNRSQSGSPFQTTSVAPQRETTWKDKAASTNNVEVFINRDCYCGPYLEAQKLFALPKVYRGNIVKVLKNVLEDTIKCASDSKTVFGFLKPGRGNCVITAACDGVTYQCCLNNIDRVSKFWTVLEQFSDNLRCCQNLFSSTKFFSACSRCVSTHSSLGPGKRSSSNLYGYSSHSGDVARGNRGESSSASFDNYYKSSPRSERGGYVTPAYSVYSSSRLENELARMQPINLSRHDSVFERTRPEVVMETKEGQNSLIESGRRDSYLDPEKEDVNVDGLDDTEPVLKKKKVTNMAGGVEISSAPKTWSIDDVTAFLQQTDLKDYIEKFKENEIDGKALLLLQRDLILTHMGFKLGPAVKLLDLIAELRTAQEKYS
ncbi:polycomb protein Scm-like isoform X2 [Hydractinia symbiolongicarpus]|uniref:polycomb protein Scm-like isoform X2 n=1 Tax=Hydractinia symbiolongicarpus TaxID=13093 RepID=UPI00254D283D|nr:polycomb protein Scm-like isoform X2 [Hydractinia symbiolongicarpus]